jgi:hypothetical protein
MVTPVALPGVRALTSAVVLFTVVTVMVATALRTLAMVAAASIARPNNNLLHGFRRDLAICSQS